MKLATLMLAASVGSTMFFGSGCANHLRNINIVTQENDRKVLRTKYELKLTPETIRDSSYHVEIQKHESAEVRKFDVLTVKTVATPYSGWRELYEIPSGICLLPVSLGAHMCFLFTFGILPYDIPKSINELAFTGMNPALNWENEDRSEENLLSLDRKMLSNTVENIKVPLARTNIIVTSGTRSKVLTTDDFGGVELNFLALTEKDTFFPMARKVSFALESDKNTELKRLILTRDYLSKLTWARTRLNAYRMNPNGRNLFQTVIYLEKNGFEQLAYMLEESELARKAKDKKFLSDFKSASIQR